MAWRSSTLASPCPLGICSRWKSRKRSRAVTGSRRVALTPLAASLFVVALLLVRAPGVDAHRPKPRPRPSPSASASLSPSASPSPSATWPDASNTGVPTGIALTVIVGGFVVTQPGTHLDALDVRGCIEVRAADVVISRSKVACASFYVVGSFAGAYTGTGLLVEDSELDCLATGGTGMGDTN